MTLTLKVLYLFYAYLLKTRSLLSFNFIVLTFLLINCLYWSNTHCISVTEYQWLLGKWICALFDNFIGRSVCLCFDKAKVRNWLCFVLKRWMRKYVPRLVIDISIQFKCTVYRALDGLSPPLNEFTQLNIYVIVNAIDNWLWSVFRDGEKSRKKRISSKGDASLTRRTEAKLIEGTDEWLHSSEATEAAAKALNEAGKATRVGMSPCWA